MKDQKDPSAVTPIRPLRAQEDTLSADSSHRRSQVELPLVHELRQVIAELQGKHAAQERQIKELRDAVVALKEPGMPRVLRTSEGIIVLDKKF